MMGVQDGAYAHGYGYDVWGNLTQRGGWDFNARGRAGRTALEEGEARVHALTFTTVQRVRLPGTDLSILRRVPIPFHSMFPETPAQQIEFRYQIFKAAYDLALKALSKTDCSALAITGNLEQSAAAVLRGIYEKGNFKYNSTPHIRDTLYGHVVPAGTENAGHREKSTIWLFPSFYNNDGAAAIRANTGRPDLTDAQARALILLHELRHAFGDKHATQADSDQWNRIIANTCFL